MAAPFLEKLQIPDGFEELLHDLIKEILREQPDNINLFCAEYFHAQKNGHPKPTNFARNKFGTRRESETARQYSESCVSESINEPNSSEQQPSHTGSTDRPNMVDQASQGEIVQPSKKSLAETDKENILTENIPQTPLAKEINEETKSLPRSVTTMQRVGSEFVNDLTDNIISEYQSI